VVHNQVVVALGVRYQTVAVANKVKVATETNLKENRVTLQANLKKLMKQLYKEKLKKH
jgi:hypothetical protein